MDKAIGKLLDNNQSPGRKVGEIDNRTSHFFLAIYWAEALAKQNENALLKAHFSHLAKRLSEKKEKILEELNSAQGIGVDIGGYFKPNPDQVAAALRPSKTLNAIIDL